MVGEIVGEIVGETVVAELVVEMTVDEEAERVQGVSMVDARNLIPRFT